jgi:hypothetical protein
VESRAAIQKSAWSNLKAYDTSRLIVFGQSLRISLSPTGEDKYQLPEGSFIEFFKAPHNRSGTFFAIRTPLFVFFSEAKGQFILSQTSKMLKDRGSLQYVIISTPTPAHELSQETARDIANLCSSNGVTPIMIATWISGETNLLMSNEVKGKYGTYLPSGFVVFPKVVRSCFDMGYG